MQLKPKQTGFTLIELLIVVVVIGILAAIAIPSYFDSVRKSRRSDGKAALMTLSLAQEKYRANNPSYATTLAAAGISATSPDGYYTVEIVGTPDAVSFVARAKPNPKGGQNKDAPCGINSDGTTANDNFRITQDGPDKSNSTKQACWGN